MLPAAVSTPNHHRRSRATSIALRLQSGDARDRRAGARPFDGITRAAMSCALLCATFATSENPAAALPQDRKQALAELPLAGARDMTGEGRAYVETLAERDTYFIDEPIRVRVRIGLERPFLEKDMVQLFPSRLDVPAQLQAAWLDELPGVVPHAQSPALVDPRERRLSIAIGESVADAVRVENENIGGNTYTVLEIERTWRPTRAGDLEIPSPLLRFAYATTFHDDWTGRVPTDRRDAYVRGEPLVLRILPLPEEGRPAGFSGGVGRFSIRAEATPRTVEVGESVVLLVRISGEGNLDAIEPPRLDELKGFTVLGRIETSDAGTRSITYDLRVDDESVHSVPPIALTWFDPTPPGAYTRDQTQSIPLVVSRAGGPRQTASDEGGALAPGMWISALVLCSVGIVVIWFLRRRPSDQHGARVYDAALSFTRRVEDPDVDLAQAYLEFLAVLLDCAVPAVAGTRLADRLVAAGVPADLAARSAATLERVLAARAGTRAPFETKKSNGRIVDALERSLHPAEEPVEAPAA
jgi:hypothetical protein